MTASNKRREEKAREKAMRRAAGEPIILTFDFPPGFLAAWGPIITTDLTIPESYRSALEGLGKPIPKPVHCAWLIDTGADTCVVKQEIADEAGLKLIAQDVPMTTVGAETTGNIYIGRVVFAMASKRAEGFRRYAFIDTQIFTAKFERADRFAGVIGRDVLSHFDLSYNGRSGKLRMKYIDS